ncbi:hypothetical protein ACE193_00745 [Bernardetia sp. OM2101]|uniref:hypothetical protein n=1 Tax=Bernardetia sp. OM2101 TaxID=3344876 RepID=UPI0035D04AAD
MKHTKWLFFSFLLLSSILNTNLLFAQNDSTKIEAEIEYEYDTIIVKRKIKKKSRYPDYKKSDLDFYLSPLALLEPCATAYFGVEYFLDDKISVHTDIGYILNFRKERTGDNQIALPHSSYPSYVIKPEIRFYTKNNPQKASYHAIKLMFRNMNYKEEQFVYDEYFYDENNQSWTVSGNGYDSDYRVRRRSIGIQYIKGWKGKFAKSWISNFYFGVGVRYISNQPIDKRPTPFGDNSDVLEIDYLELEKQYKLISMDVALGFRIGTKLKKR